MIGELIILYNTLFNLILLIFTKEVTGLYISNRRLIGSALASAIIATVLPPSLLTSLLSFIILIGIAFSFQIRSFMVQGSWLVVGTLLAGGLLTALQPILLGHSWLTYLLLSAGLAFISLILVKLNWHKKLQQVVQQSFLTSCELLLFDQVFQVSAFIDTGNECVEPLSRQPVHFISYKTIQDKLESTFKEALEQWQEDAPLNVSMFPSNFRKAIRFVPITTIQEKTVIVPAFRVSSLEVQGKSFTGHYIIFTKNDAQFPQNAEMILHVFVLTN